MSRKPCSVAAACVIIAASLAVAAYGQDEQLQIPVLQDEMVAETFPSYNWSSTSYLGGLAVGTDYRGRAARSYLQWSLSSLDSGKPVGRAKLRAYLSHESYQSDRPIKAHLCADDSWSASTITWNNAPQPAPGPAAAITPPLLQGEYYEWDVTELVEAELAGDGKLSIVFMESAEGDSPATFKYFAEKEYNGGGNQAVLVVTQTDGEPDTTPPEITVSCAPDTLWPANHQYVTVEVNAEATDDTDGTLEPVFVSAVSSEPDDAEGGGDGNTTNDIVPMDNTTFKLRAERRGSGNGRTYTITYSAVDEAGNEATASCTVVVPHDKGKKGAK